MAIEKNIFTTTSQTANAPEVFAWLTANSAEYFDTVTADENGNITCTKDGKNVLVLGFDGTVKDMTVYLANGVSRTSYSADGMFSYGIKTSCGLFINASTNKIFITKSNNGGLSFASIIHTGSNAYYFTIGDFYTSKTFNSTSPVTTMVSAGQIFSHGGDLTTLSEIVCPGGTYLPHVFTTPFTVYLGTECILEKNGVRYWYNGYIALRE